MSDGSHGGLPRPRVATIPAGTPFLDALVAGLLDRYGAGPDGVAAATVLLPNRRAAQSLRDAFLRHSEGRALLLPAMRPLGDVDEDELALEPGDAAELMLPPSIGPLRRQLLLMQLVQAAHKIDSLQAAPLARELAEFLNEMQREGVPLDDLQELVPETFAEHWQKTLSFLQVLAEPWSRLLEAEGALDPVDRRNRLIRARAASWQANPPAGPVIAAGSTGSIPATAELLAVVAHLPEGMVVLPGLDRTLDDAAWAGLRDDHPQFGMKQLLGRIGLVRAEVIDWDAPARPESEARSRLVQEALRPSDTTELWHEMPPLPAEAGAGLQRIDCEGEHEEALTIALAMRRTLEAPGRTAALVTPDRGLARRVAAELKRWSIEVDDSAGIPLAATPPAALLRLVATAFAEGMAPVAMLALLKHPLALAGRSPGHLRALARLLDRRALRGPRPAPGLAVLHDIAGDINDPDSGELQALLMELHEHGRSFEAALSLPETGLVELLEAHVALAEWMACDIQGESQLWRGEAGEALAGFLNELLEAADGLPPIATAGYPGFLAGLMEGRAVRPRYGRHPRLSIWGPLEARLQQADLLILGGLNEGSWPAAADVDAWLSRPMRAQLGLPAPERRIGQSAHDFVQAASAPNVMLTRAEKVSGSPTVPSRWLLRLERVLFKAGVASIARDAGKWRHWASALQDAGEPRPIEPPECRPPVRARPRRLSVTRVELWMRDPYAIYARYILGLEALEPVDADAGAAERGTAVHDALDRFMKAFPAELPVDARARLEAFGEEAFGGLLERPGVRAFWWPRFLRVADWFIANERSRRDTHAVAASEVRGRLEIAGPAGPFVLSAAADRIDRLRDGRLAIVDYKTGVLPSGKDIELGIAPQLPLEAAMAAAGAFDGLDAAQVAELSYWKLGGGRRPAEVRTLRGDPMAAAEAALEGLVRLVAEFDNPGTAYRARPRPAAAPRFSDYDHLARVKEWSAGGPGDW